VNGECNRRGTRSTRWYLSTGLRAVRAESCATVKVNIPHLPRQAGCMAFLALLPIGYLPALIAASAQSVAVPAALPVCDRHARKGIPTGQTTGRLLMILMGLLLGLLFVGLIGQELFPETNLRGIVCWGGAAVFAAGWLVLFLHSVSAVRVIEINDRTATLSNLSSEFAAAAKAQRETDRQARIARLEKKRPPAVYE
jgi:hypothetical protein